MIKTLSNIALSVVMTAGLYFSTGDLRLFMYALTWAFVILAALNLFAGEIKGDIAEKIYKASWYNWPLTALAVAATVAAGYPNLAAIRLVLSFAIAATARSVFKGVVK